MLSFGGHALLLPDPDGELMRFLDRYQPLDDLQLFGEPKSLKSDRWSSRWESRLTIGLPVANYPAMPRLQLNTLYWPTGASRWAYGVFLCDGATKNKIVADAHDSNTNALTFKFGDTEQQQLETEMYLLPPRPVAVLDSQGDSDLWLLPLVDDRYWWQFLSTGNTLEAADGTYLWDDVFSALNGIGPTFTHDDVAAAYLRPDPTEITRRYDSLAVVMDAAALSVGQRFVRWLDGTVKAVNAETADEQLVDNQELEGDPIAGGDMQTQAGNAPAEVTVAYRKSRDHHPYCDGEIYILTEAAPEDIRALRASSKHIVHSTAFADYTDNYYQESPNNGTALETLKDKIAADYYDWLGLRFDHTFQGVREWFPCGAEDHIQWIFGRQCAGQYEAHTRIVSLPSNFAPETQLSQDPDLMPMLDDYEIGILTTTLMREGSGTVRIVQFNEDDHLVESENHEGDPIDVLAWDNKLGPGDELEADTRVDLHWNCRSNRYMVANSGCQADPLDEEE